MIKEISIIDAGIDRPCMKLKGEKGKKKFI